MQNIEIILKDAMKEHKMEVPIVAWPFIAASLRKRKKRRVIWFFLSVFIMLILGISSFLLYYTKNETPNKKFNNFLLVENNNINIIDETTKSKTKKDTLLLGDNNYAILLTQSEKKEDNIKAILSPSKKRFSKNYKTRTALKVTFPATSNDEEKIIDKTATLKNKKNRTKVNIQNSTFLKNKPLQDDEILNSENELIQVETKSINNIESIISSTKQYDSINLITKTNVDIKKDTDKIEEAINKSKATSTKIKKEKNWGRYFGLSYGALYSRSNSIFKNENIVANTNRLQSQSTVGQAFTNNSNVANYQNGKEISASFLFKKENKKLRPMFGINVNMGSFKAKAYNASSALLDATTLLIDSTQTGNSAYASIRSIGTNQVNIRNNYLQVGLMLGYAIPLYSFKNGSKILVQAQVIPTYNLAQSIEWHDNISGRYFTSKKLNNNFNITQSTTFLWEATIKNRIVAIGPYFNFNYFKLNKSVNNISNIYTRSIGTSVQIKFKK